jgi:hypothetical protein
VIELDLSKLPVGTPKIAAAEVKWGKGTKAYRDTKSVVATDLSPETTALLQETAVSAYQALELRDYGRIDMRLKPDGTVVVIDANPNPWLASRAELALAARGRPNLRAVDRRSSGWRWPDTRISALTLTLSLFLLPVRQGNREHRAPGARLAAYPPAEELDQMSDDREAEPAHPDRARACPVESFEDPGESPPESGPPSLTVSSTRPRHGTG